MISRPIIVRKSLFVLFMSAVVFSCQNNPDIITPEKTQPNNTVAKEYYSKGYQFSKQHKYDSAYYNYFNALLQFKKIKDSLWTTRAFIKLAIIDYKNANYLATESNCISALEHLPKKAAHLKEEAKTYNLLGLATKSQGLHDESISYFNSYHKLGMQLDFSLFDQIAYYNNVGTLYTDKMDYSKSFLYFDKIIQIDSIETIYPDKYARALDNKAWALLLNNNATIAFPLFTKALKFRETHRDKPGLAMSYLHLANYYENISQNKNAYNYALKTYKLCTETHNSEIEMKALSILSRTDNKNAAQYFNKYRELKNKLCKQEQNYKNQTAKISFETFKKEKKISTQKKEIATKDKALLWGTIIGILVGISALMFWLQKRKIGKQKEHLSTQNELITALKKEVHHNVKNDLTMVLSYLNQTKKAPNKVALEDLKFRIKSILYLHEQLYSENTGDLVDMQDYISNICHGCHFGFKPPNKEITYQINCNIALPSKKGKLIGVIVNESVTNIYKHAFNTKESGHYEIQLAFSDTTILLKITDNGEGYARDFNIDKLTSFGMKNVKGITSELDRAANFMIKSNNNGTQIEIVFNKEKLLKINKKL